MYELSFILIFRELMQYDRKIIIEIKAMRLNGEEMETQISDPSVILHVSS